MRLAAEQAVAMQLLRKNWLRQSDAWGMQGSHTPVRAHLIAPVALRTVWAVLEWFCVPDVHYAQGCCCLCVPKSEGCALHMGPAAVHCCIFLSARGWLCLLCLNSEGCACEDGCALDGATAVMFTFLAQLGLCWGVRCSLQHLNQKPR